jgi:hypothetical protein
LTGQISPTIQIDSAPIKNREASLSISITFEDLGDGMPEPDVHIIDAHEKEMNHTGSCIQIGCLA